MAQQNEKKLLKCKMEHNPVVFVQKNEKHFKCPNCGAHMTKEIDLSTFIRELSPTVLWNARSKNVTVYVEKETPLLLSNVKYLTGQGFNISIKQTA